jgi:hypothetical protein
MKKLLVLNAAIAILFFPLTLSWGQQTVSEEAMRHRDRGIAAVEMAKSAEDYGAAIKEFEQAVKLAPGWADAYYNLGMVQATAEKYADAITNLKQYLRLAPNATEAETVKALINKLEYKKENMLSVSEVIDVLVSREDDARLPHANRLWKESFRPPATCWLGYDVGFGWGLTRAGDDSVRVRTRSVFPYVVDGNIKAQTGEEPTHYYETARVEGRILRFRFTYVNWDTPTELETEVEVVSKTLIRVKETVTKPGPWNKEWREGQSVSGEFRKAANIDANDAKPLPADADVNAKGTDVNAKDENGQTPLHIAICGGQREEVELLIAKGADINAKDNSGQTPLHYAAVLGQKEVVELLIAKGADINARGTNAWTPLHWAAMKGQSETARVLIAKGADVNAKDKHGWTPLHDAALIGNKEVAELLIAKGADINAKDGNGQTLLQFAESVGHKDVADLLRKHGAR